jgi:hypothetical protein
MNNTNSSVETLIVDTPNLRRNVDIGVYIPLLEKAATEDSYLRGELYTIPEFTREIIDQFLRIRDYCRTHDLPLYRPSDVTDMIITGEYKEP